MQSFKSILIITCFFITISLHAQMQNPAWYVGPYGAIMQSNHTTTFKDMPGYPTCCSTERSGTGIGYDIGMLFRFPIHSDLNIRIFGGINSPGSTISNQEKIGNQFIRNPQFPFDSIARDITVSHSIEAMLTQISLRPMIAYALPFGGDFTAGLGFSFVMNHTFNQRETLISPDNAAFPDGRGIRNESSGDIPNIATFQTSIAVGYSHDFPISSSSLLMPFIEYHHPLQSLTSYDWNISKLQLGLALQFGMIPSKTPTIMIDTIYRRDTMVTISPIAVSNPTELINRNSEYVKGSINNDIRLDTVLITEKYLLTLFTPPGYEGNISVFGLDAQGKTTSKPIIKIEEWEQIETFPILPYIYFEEGSSDLGGTNQNLLLTSQTGFFKEDSLPSSTLGIYRDMLNIIGSRAKTTGSPIDIIGFTNTMPADNLPGIAKQRSQAIGSYFQSIWGLNPDLMTIQFGSLPGLPSNTSLRDGQTENARAEIKSKNSEILKPLKKSTIIRTMNPPILAIKPEIQAGKAIRSWEIIINDGNETLQTFKGEGSIPDSTFTWTIKPSSQMSAIPLTVTLNAVDTHDISHSWDVEVLTERITLRNKQELRINDTLIERFALILFDFDKSNLSPANQSIAQTIKQSITPTSNIIITGYTDRTGDSSYNHALSEARCRQVSQFLGLSAGSYIINPLGGKELPFENDSPQGRAYSRTVMIEVRTPIKDRK